MKPTSQDREEIIVSLTSKYYARILNIFAGYGLSLKRRVSIEQILTNLVEDSFAAGYGMGKDSMTIDCMQCNDNGCKECKDK